MSESTTRGTRRQSLCAGWRLPQPRSRARRARGRGRGRVHAGGCVGGVGERSTSDGCGGCCEYQKSPETHPPSPKETSRYSSGSSSSSSSSSAGARRRREPDIETRASAARDAGRDASRPQPAARTWRRQAVHHQHLVVERPAGTLNHVAPNSRSVAGHHAGAARRHGGFVILEAQHATARRSHRVGGRGVCSELYDNARAQKRRRSHRALIAHAHRCVNACFVSRYHIISVCV